MNYKSFERFMKFIAVIAALFVTEAVSQSGYNFGNPGAVILPTGPTGGSTPSSSTQTGTGTISGSSITIPTFPKADLFQLSQQGLGNPNLTNQIVSSVLASGKNELSTPVRSMPSLFTRFPSKSEIQKFADDGDVGGITKTLQVVSADDSVPCGTKLSYLLDLLGAVKNAIKNKTTVADQLAAVIDAAKAQIARLQDEITKTQKDRDALKIPDLEAKVTDLSARLNDLYVKINAVRDQIPPEEARLTGYERELATLNKQNDEERNKITNDKLKVAQTDNLIKDLEQRLRDARDTRNAILASIATSENLIKDNQKKIDNIKSTIADINAKIKNLQDTIDNLKRQTNTIQVDLERARTDLSVAKVKDTKLANDIKDFQDKIAAEQPKLVDDDLKNLRTLIDNLQKLIPRIDTDINRQYYYCYGAGKVKEENVGSVIVYVVKGEAFGHYIQTAYGQAVGAPNLRQTEDYRLQLVDPYSQIWTAKYGYPGLAGPINGGAFPNDFSCLNASTGSSGMGLITGISSDGFMVKDASGNPVKLNIGSCSRVESTVQLPQVGQNVAWRGVPSSAGGYNIYSATCW